MIKQIKDTKNYSENTYENTLRRSLYKKVKILTIYVIKTFNNS